MSTKKTRADFPALKDWTYLDTAFVGLYPTQTKQAYEEFVDNWMLFKVKPGKTILGEWLDKAEKVRRMIADFINAHRDEIAYTMCTGSGLNVVINGTAWIPGDNVVFPEWEHNPLDTHTLRRNRVQVRAVKPKDGMIELSDLEKAVDDRTRLVQLSQVSYVNGFRFNLREVADLVHAHGAKLLVDSTQAVGAFRIDVAKEGVDYLSAAPYKYLMGPAGLAFLYVSKENIDALTPDRVGWKNQLWQGERAEAPLENMQTAEKIEYGTIHFQGCYGLEKSLEYLNSLGMDTVEHWNHQLSEHCWNRIHELGAQMYTPEKTESPIVSFYQKQATKLSRQLMEQGIKVTGREAHGGHIRVSTHFYNSKDDVDHFADRLVIAQKNL